MLCYIDKINNLGIETHLITACDQRRECTLQICRRGHRRSVELLGSHPASVELRHFDLHTRLVIPEAGLVTRCQSTRGLQRAFRIRCRNIGHTDQRETDLFVQKAINRVSFTYMKYVEQWGYD